MQTFLSIPFINQNGLPAGPASAGHSGWLWFALAVFWVLALAWVFFTLKWFAGNWKKSESGALQTLRKRYASGEIGRKEYEKGMEALKGKKST